MVRSFRERQRIGAAGKDTLWDVRKYQFAYH